MFNENLSLNFSNRFPLAVHLSVNVVQIFQETDWFRRPSQDHVAFVQSHEFRNKLDLFKNIVKHSTSIFLDSHFVVYFKDQVQIVWILQLLINNLLI